MNMKACGDIPNSLNHLITTFCLPFFFFNPIVMLELQMLAIIYLYVMYALSAVNHMQNTGIHSQFISKPGPQKAKKKKN